MCITRDKSDVRVPCSVDPRTCLDAPPLSKRVPPPIMAAPWNLAPGRSIDLELGGQEVVTVELDELDPNADDIIDVLKEGQAKVAYWTRLAGEYLQNGNVDAAEKICVTAVESAY